MENPTTNVTVTMVSDFICPWCRIGEKRLADAIASLPDDVSVSIRLRPFELNPDMLKEGMDRKIYRSRKFGSWARSQQLDAGTIAAGKADGVTFNYDIMERTPNTFMAHKLTHWAEKSGHETDVAHRILGAYFVEGRDIGDVEVLAAIASEAGLNGDAATTYLVDSSSDDEIRDVLRETVQNGVSAVPQFDVDGTIVRGAQSSEVLAEVIRTAAASRASSALQEA